MTKTFFLALGLALLAAMPILSTLDEQPNDRVARLAAPEQVVTAPILR